jgi:hypothetical protein
VIRLLDHTEARHFCRALGNHQPGVGQSLADFHDRIRVTHLRENAIDFEIHRVSLLNAVERWILFGVAGYRRALDMFIPSNAPWAHVTLYYSSFYAANAILGMFGAWIHYKRVVDVENGSPNAQVLRISRRVRSPSSQTGSHRVFWDLFYEGCNLISGWVPTKLQPPTSPVNNDRFWQVTNRNEVNYDMFKAFEGATLLENSFNPRRFRRSLRGPLAQQLEVSEGMLKLAIHFANDFQISSFPYLGLGEGSRSILLRKLVSRVPPGLTNQSELQSLFQ